MFDAYRVAIRLQAIDEVSGPLAALHSRLKAADVSAKEFHSQLQGIGKTLAAGVFTTGAGIGLAMALKASTNEAVKLEQQVNRLKALNLGVGSNRLLLDKAQEITRTTKGTTQLEATQLVTEAQAITGNVQHSLELAPLMAKMKFGMETYMAESGHGEGHGEGAEKQFAAVVKAMEMQGLMRDFSTEKMERMADLFTKNYVASGGMVKPDQFLGMLKTAGVAGKSVNEDFMFALGHIMQEKGGGRSGTQLMSAYQGLVAGRSTQQVAEQLQKFGLLKHDSIEYGTTGHIKKVKPEALKAAELMEANPLDYMNQMLLPALKAKGIDINDSKRVLPIINQLTSSRTAADFLAGLYLERDNIANYIGQAKGASGVGQLYMLSANSMVGKERDLHAKLNRLEVAFGKAALPILVGALQVAVPMVERLGKAMERHPTALKAIAGGVAAFAGVLVATGPLLAASGLVRSLGVAVALFRGGAAITETATALGQFRLGLSGLATPFKLLGKVSGGFLSLLGRGLPYLMRFVGFGSLYVTAAAAAFSVGYAIGWTINKAIDGITHFLTGCDTFAEWLFRGLPETTPILA